MFLVLEGPNGVGKSTCAAALADRLRSVGRRVHLTREPSDSEFGRAIRHSESSLLGVELAMACAADRLHHVRTEVEPALDSGQIVISDRYVPSSLVLQRLDGLDIEEIWRLNILARAPELIVYVEAPADTIASRLRERDQSSRLERRGDPVRELDYYREAHDFLHSQGWNQMRVGSTRRSVQDVVDDILSRCS